MSDYIIKSELLETLAKYKFGAISNDAEREYTKEMMLLIVGEQPTLDETEIIRKAFERVVERLEEFTEQTYYKSVEGDMYAGERNKAYHNAIKIVKEECGISE